MNTPIRILAGVCTLATLLATPVKADDPLAREIVRSLTGGGATRSLRARGIDVQEPVRMEPTTPGAIALPTPSVPPGAAIAVPTMPLTAPVPFASTAPVVPVTFSYDLQITFETGSAALTPQAQLQLRSLATALNDPSLAASRIRIAGHTDARGSDAMNMQLSMQRADTVRRHLWQAYGIDPNRIEAIGFGESRLKDPMHPAAEVNRRVEITNLGR